METQNEAGSQQAVNQSSESPEASNSGRLRGLAQGRGYASKDKKPGYTCSVIRPTEGAASVLPPQDGGALPASSDQPEGGVPQGSPQPGEGT